MKAFISYSLADRDLYFLTLLAKKLREKGYSLITGTNVFSDILDFTTTQQISSSQLFIGIISTNGMQRYRVFEEWKYSLNSKIPSVLLIEEGIKVTGGIGSYVRFNRYNPDPAIEEIQKRMVIKKNNETMAWLLAGAALVALLAALSESNKK